MTSVLHIFFHHHTLVICVICKNIFQPPWLTYVHTAYQIFLSHLRVIQTGMKLRICCCQANIDATPWYHCTCLQTKIKIFDEFDYTSLGIRWILCWMAEWQKRGLPHAHILIWLVDKVRPEEIDKIISAEIPDPNVHKNCLTLLLLIWSMVHVVL